MRTINIQEVGMENFGSYTDPMVLEFKKDTLVLMTGPNGCGKTTSIDAIPFTFYNATTKGAKGDDLVNNNAGKNCKTWVKFLVNDKDQYIVTRYQKYTRFGNTVILNKNGKDIKKGQREVLPVIEKLICSKRAFMNTLMFGQKVKDFFTDLVDSDKKLIFRELLSLEQYDSYHKTTTNLLKDNLQEQIKIDNSINISTGLLEDAKKQIESILLLKKRFEDGIVISIKEIETSIRDSQRLLKEWHGKTEVLMTKDINVQNTITELEKVNLQLTSLYNEETQQTDKVKHQQSQKIAEIQTKASDAKTDVLQKSKDANEEIQNDINKYQKKVIDLDSFNKNREYEDRLHHSNIINKIKNWEQLIEEIETNVLKAEISQCPTCKQEIDDTIIKELQAKVDEYKSGIDTATTVIEKNVIKSDKEYKKYKQQHQLINKTIVELQSKQQNLQSEIDKQTFDITDRGNVAIEQVNKLAVGVIKEVVDKFVIKKELCLDEKSQLLKVKEAQDKILSEIETIKETIIQLDNEIKQKQYRLEEKKKEKFDETQLQNYQDKILSFDISIEMDYISLEERKKNQIILEFWKVAFSSSGIPSMLIDEAVPFMNEKVAYYLDKFTAGRYIVSFDTLAETKGGEFRDKISVNVIDTHTRANNRVQLSGGQTRIIDIATILTLGDLQATIQGVSINILLFDEIFDALDDTNIGFVSKVLNQIKEGKSIYLISHRHVDELETDQVLNFQK